MIGVASIRTSDRLWLGTCGHTWPAPDPMKPTPCPQCNAAEDTADAA